MMDAVDAIMEIMRSAFDPAFGEAWNRQQVIGALSLPNTHFLLSDATGSVTSQPEEAVGFTLSRLVLDEEELLLFAVKRTSQGQGIGNELLRAYLASARKRGATQVFLEMRDGNPAARLYLANGFQSIGRRPDYYKSGNSGPFDAITYKIDCS